MALPWLIGGALIAAVSYIANKSSDDDDDDDDDERESRRRAEAARMRVEAERNKRLNAAQENFASRGESIGSEIAASLQGWIDVQINKSPSFSVKLSSESHQIERSGIDEASIRALIPNGDLQFGEICKNLKTYSSVYAVKLQKGPRLLNANNELLNIDLELRQIEKIKSEISKIRNNISTQT